MRPGYRYRVHHPRTLGDPVRTQPRARGVNLNDFQNVKFCQVGFSLPLHDENVLEALVIFSTVLGRAVAKTVEP